MIDIGNRIKELRKLRNLSQRELAEIVGMNQGQYSRIESCSLKTRCLDYSPFLK